MAMCHRKKVLTVQIHHGTADQQTKYQTESRRGEKDMRVINGSPRVNTGCWIENDGKPYKWKRRSLMDR